VIEKINNNNKKIHRVRGTIMLSPAVSIR